MVRRGVTFMELMVVLGIIGLVLALFFPAVQMVRHAANRVVCGNNLRQVGLGLHMYHDDHNGLPYVRLCPAPWCGGTDLHCETLTSPTTYTGPNETWWAPYDNRPGTNPTRALPDYVPKSLVWEYVGEVKVFRCPDGIDPHPNSPTYGRPFQICYALNASNNGRKLLDAGDLAWDHCDLPGCKDQQPIHWTGFATSAQELIERHRPRRHGGVHQVLQRDGNVRSARWIGQ